MKTNCILTVSLATLFMVGCSKTSPTPTNQNETVEVKSVNSNTINQIADEESEAQRMQLLLQSMTKTTLSSDVNSIVSLHSIKKLSNAEFRGLFWGAQISKELINTLKNNLDKDQQLTDLDKMLIQSIGKEEVSFDELLSEVKKESQTSIPSSMQSSLIDELVKLYAKDFENINNDQITLYEKLTPSDNSSAESFLVKAREILELEFYKKKLSNKQLVTSQNTFPLTYREIKTGFNLNYSFNIGRGGNVSNNINNFTKLSTGFGRSYNTETPSTVNLDISSDVVNYGSTTNIDLLLNSFVRGGYDKGKGENATSTLDYNLSGKVIIPRCANPSFCNQIITISVSDFGKAYQNSTQTNSGVKISVNGSNFSNDLLNRVTVDISKSDAIIDISLAGNKKHVGACCYNGATFQKVNLSIEAGTVVNFPLAAETINSLNTFQKPLGFIGFGFFPTANDLNSPPFQVSMLKNSIENVIKEKNSLNDYRQLFYTELEINQLASDSLMRSNSNPIEVLHYQQIQKSISDVIGRNMILPIINSKMQAYQNSSLLNVQQNINDMLKSILILNLNSDSAQEEIRNKLNSRINSLDSGSQELVENFIEFLKENKKGQSELLNEIASFQADFNFMTKKMDSEIELLNLEKAQFSEHQTINPVKVQ